MPLDHLTSEELVQYVFNHAQNMSHLEKLLAERLSQALDAVEDFGVPD